LLDLLKQISQSISKCLPNTFCIPISLLVVFAVYIPSKTTRSQFTRTCILFIYSFI